MADLTTDERRRLKEKQERKRSAFAWLAEFLGLRPSKNQLEKKGILPAEQPPPPPKSVYFTVPVEEVYADESRLVQGVPKPLYHSAAALEDWLLIEGVFRVSGIFSEMKRMKETFERGEIPDFANAMSKHSIAGLLELWFRELPEPVLTHELYDEFMAAVTGGKSEAEALPKLEEAVAKLPHGNREVLKFFGRFMSKVAALEHENKMGAKNLGVVFGSILLGSKSLSFTNTLKQQLNDQNTIVQLIITHVDTLFPPEDDDAPAE